MLYEIASQLMEKHSILIEAAAHSAEEFAQQVSSEELATILFVTGVMVQRGSTLDDLMHIDDAQYRVVRSEFDEELLYYVGQFPVILNQIGLEKVVRAMILAGLYYAAMHDDFILNVARSD